MRKLRTSRRQAIGWLTIVAALATGLAIADAPARKREQEAFLKAARAAQPQLARHPVRVRTIGSSERASATIIALILDGSKTGTFSLADDFASDPRSAPVAGQYWMVTHLDGRPALIYRLTAVETVPFGRIGAEHVAMEGPALRTVEAWRSVHRAAWTPALARRGSSLSDETPVVVQRFVLVYPSRR